MTSAFRLRWLRAEPPAASSRPLRLAACLRTAAARAAGRRASAAQPGGWRQHAKTQHRLALLWGAHSLTACAPLRLPREGRQQRAGAAHRSTSASSRPPASSGMSAAAERRSRRPPARNATCVGQLSRPSKMCVAYARAGLGERPQGPTAVGYRVFLPYPSPGHRRCASPARAPAWASRPRAQQLWGIGYPYLTPLQAVEDVHRLRARRPWASRPGAPRRAAGRAPRVWHRPRQGGARI